MQVNDVVTSIRIEDYTYELPADRIAYYPLKERDTSKLLVSSSNGISTAFFGQVSEFLPERSLLVLNNTRVVQARLEFFKETGARIEVFCLQPVSPLKDVGLALGHSSPVVWQCLVGNAKKWKGEPLRISDPDKKVNLTAEVIKRNDQEFEIKFSWQPDHLSFGEILELAGRTPLPPYIARKAEISDRTTYQTVFARQQGSVAAPTAGLHFTPEVFQKLEKKSITPKYLTLHVGAGTFKPVSSDTIGQHQMHSEQFSVEKSFIHDLIENNSPVISVGTTSMRTLESLYWLGAKIYNGYNPAGNYAIVQQWEPYMGNHIPGIKEAFKSIIKWMDKNDLNVLQGETALIIVPGYNFKVVDVLITNFHQPKSTLLLLVAAFAGQQWKQAYDYALKNSFRFLSYGDSCLFFRNNKPYQE